MDSETSVYYSQNASKLAEEYATGAHTLEDCLTSVFARSHKILDVGCGTGRDLSFLIGKGKDACGVDPSREMLAVAHQTLGARGISSEGRLFLGSLPDLRQFVQSEFDGVLCSAVMMHLPEEELFDAVYGLRRVLRPGGTLLVSVPVTRNDVDPITRRDRGGRLFTELPASKLHLLFERVGFVVRESQQVGDSLGRSGISWSITEFRLEESADRPLHLVESILSRDKKDATYKLALFRALAEIAQTQHHLAAFTHDGKVKIPLQAIADKWLLYYWPIFESEIFICQRTGEKQGAANGVAIRRPLLALIDYFRSSGGMSGFYARLNSGKLSRDAEGLWKKARSKFQETIWSMPVRYAGGGQFSVFQYDPADKSVCMESKLWRELCLTGSWIQDATILRWAELTEQLSKGAVRASTVIDCLLSIPDPARNVNDAKGYYSKLGERVCVWSGRPLSDGKFDIDHAMPFSLWRNNELWNLFPADPAINSQKSDKLPTYVILNRRREAIIDYWQGLNESLGEQFSRGAQTLLGRDSFAHQNWENRLFSRFVEAFEITAAQRGAPRWEIAGVSLPSPVFVNAGLPVWHNTAAVKLETNEDLQSMSGPRIVRFLEVGKGAFKTHLPLVGSLAAGQPFHGLETSNLADASDLDWIEVVPRLAGERRFVVRIAGDSMEPFLRIGDLVVFEYHRSPRKNGQIVIANIPEFGSTDHGVESIKRIYQDAEQWIFQSENPSYADFSVPKYLTASPILGIMIEKLGGTGGFTEVEDRCPPRRVPDVSSGRIQSP
jgi:SAM-dependent methyltransferase/SOS-response transcriptional repressor LexA